MAGLTRPGAEAPERWQDRLVSPRAALARLKPGMRIFVSTGVAEPRTLIRALMASREGRLEDLELIQLVSFGDALSLSDPSAQRFRLKTFYPGYVVSDAISEGRVDWIPCDFAQIPGMFETGQIPVDVAFVQITPPDEGGYASVGVSVDVSRTALERASLVVGEINPDMPRTSGDTLVAIGDFDLLVESSEPTLVFPRPPVSEVHRRIAAAVADLIEDGSCLAFSIGPLFEGLAPELARRRHLGIHTPVFTDALMDLTRSGAVTNRRKEVFRGKSLTSYAMGTEELMRWLHLNPSVEFQPVDKSLDPFQMGRNPRFVAILAVDQVDLMGRVVQPRGRRAMATGPAEAAALLTAAKLSPGGRAICALPSRNRRGEPNVRLAVDERGSHCPLWLSVDLVVTEYGEAYLWGRTVRERAQALIDVAHPDDRPRLVAEAKAARILYSDQIFLAESARSYPSEVTATETLAGGIEVRFRAIKPSDEEGMRRLFYRFSDDAVYYRFFSHVKSMPHARMQEYVNVDFRNVMSVVALVGPPGEGTIIAEGRWTRIPGRPSADLAFVVDEAYQRRGLGTRLYRHLAQLARERGIKQLEADVLVTNSGMRKLMERGGVPVRARLEEGVYHLIATFDDDVDRRICS